MISAPFLTNVRRCAGHSAERSHPICFIRFREVLFKMQEDLLKRMGQLMVFGFHGKRMTPELKQMIHKYKLGNIILFSRNLEDPVQIRRLTGELQKEAKKAGHRYPLLICTDQENGAVRRLGSGSTEFPGSMLLGAAHNEKYTYEIARMTAEELKSVGINWNLAPVVDVNNNPLNPVICTRSFGANPQSVARMGEAFMRGMQEGGIVPTLKHFPGHGDTGTDSHLDLPVITHELSRLEQVELVPFRHCISAGADVIMSAHIYFPVLEKQYGVPATLSRNILTGLLRDRLRFQGVITTDCLEMKAIADRFGTARGAVLALRAGADLVMVSHTYEKQMETLDRVERAMRDGEIDMQAMTQSLARIDQLKKKYLNWNEALNIETISVAALEKHRESAERIYKEGITLVKNNVLPLKPRARTLFIYSEKLFISKVEDQQNHLSVFESIVRKVNPEADVVKLEEPSFDRLLKNIKSRQENYQAIVALTASLTENSRQIEIINQLHGTDHYPIVVIAGKSPYDIRFLPDVDAYLCTYDLNRTALNIAVRTLFGLENVSGSLPVRI
ncbi:beta-N-acetylhexosaminidase [Sporolactobacillus sp. THM7-4]|nr:beta-N-acetylhexosaminidase [Sporolactobacillus sp. THM7-4]